MPPTQFGATLTDNQALSGGYYTLRFQTDHSSTPSAPLCGLDPGQFVMVRGQWGRELLNPRAFSVLDAGDDGSFSILIKVYGRGTARLAALTPGELVTITGPLGNGFTPPAGPTQLLVAGGVGLPPLHLQARRAAAAGNASAVEMFYGGRNADDLVLTADLDAWGVKTHYATEDGSRGHTGFVTVPLEARLKAAHAAEEPVEILACGPTPMLRAVRTIGMAHGVRTLLCLEEEMACGFGVCLGCAVPVHGEKPYKYCCSDGPVFEAQEVRWS